MTPLTGMNSVAFRLPKVIVPVLSKQQRVDVAGGLDRAADMASTLRCTSRSMPAMPIADSNAADGGRDQAHQQRHQDNAGDAVVGRGRGVCHPDC